MANVTVHIGALEDWTQYDDAGTYSDASTQVGVKAGRLQATTAPADPDDVVRLDDLGSLFAPHDAQYVVLAVNANLTNERVLTAGAGITITDAGAGGTVTIKGSEYWQDPVIDKDLTTPPI